MPGHLLPITSLVAAIRSKLTAELFPVEVFSLVRPGTTKPYVEIGNITWQDSSTKVGFCKDLITEFHVYDDDQNMKSCNAIMQSMLQLLTTEVLDIGEQWNVVDAPRPEGFGDVIKEADEVGIYWRGTFRLRWKIQDMQSARN